MWFLSVIFYPPTYLQSDSIPLQLSPNPVYKAITTPSLPSPTPSLSSKCVSLKKTPPFTVIKPESSEVKPVEDTPIFSPPCTLLPLWRSGHRHWKAWSSWKLKIHPHFLFCPSRASSVLPPLLPPRSPEEVSEGEGGRWLEIVCSSDGSQVLQLTNLQLVKW